MPKFEANMNYIPPSPPSSMKQCNKSATVKFHMELLFTTTTRKQSRSGATPLHRTRESACVVMYDVCVSGRVCYKYKPWFLRVCCTSLLKTLWEMEKLLVTTNFSFSHSVFYPFGELSSIFTKFDFVVCKLFQFGRV